jgi:ABC-2 type transport system permease protein
MSAMTKMVGVEGKLFLRDPGGPITVIGLPVALLVVFGLMPGIREPSADFGGRSGLSVFIAPMAVAVLLGMLALTIFPGVMATYREKGVLRRYSASPMSPRRLLGAQVLVNLVAGLVVVALVLVLGSVALGMELPSSIGWFVVSLLLGTAALFSVGLLIAAVAPTGRAASGIGSAVFFPMLALGGVWVPREQLPEVLRTAADVLPMGAAFNALRASWSGVSPNLLQLLSLVVFTAVCGFVAARVFRWE